MSSLTLMFLNRKVILWNVCRFGFVWDLVIGFLKNPSRRFSPYLTTANALPAHPVIPVSTECRIPWAWKPSFSAYFCRLGCWLQILLVFIPLEMSIFDLYLELDVQFWLNSYSFSALKRYYWVSSWSLSFVLEVSGYTCHCLLVCNVLFSPVCKIFSSYLIGSWLWYAHIWWSLCLGFTGLLKSVLKDVIKFALFCHYF